MQGSTPLKEAILSNSVSVVESLLKEERDMVEQKDEEGRTPLHWACWTGSVQCVELLLDASARVDAVSTNGWTPLMWAARKGYADVVAALIKAGAHVMMRGKQGMLAIHMAARSGRVACGALLIGADARCVLVCDSNGVSPLALALHQGHPDFARLLIDCGGRLSGLGIPAFEAPAWAFRYRDSCSRCQMAVRSLKRVLPRYIGKDCTTIVCGLVWGSRGSYDWGQDETGRCVVQ